MDINQIETVLRPFEIAAILLETCFDGFNESDVSEFIESYQHDSQKDDVREAAQIWKSLSEHQGNTQDQYEMIASPESLHRAILDRYTSLEISVAVAVSFRTYLLKSCSVTW